MIVSTLAVIASMILLLLFAILFIALPVAAQAQAQIDGYYKHSSAAGGNQEAMEHSPSWATDEDNKLHTGTPPPFQIGNGTMYRRYIGGCTVL